MRHRHEHLCTRAPLHPCTPGRLQSGRSGRRPMSDQVQPGVSRRNFIKGVIASGVVASAAAYRWRATVSGQAGGAAAGTVERLITLTVNGRERRVDVMPQETLAMTLRYKLGLTGTKIGCDRGECGACTVLVDDVPR